MNYLVVEDDPQLSEFLARVLRDEGHTATVVETAESAVMTGLRDPFDVIILDWMLPDGDGPDVASRLRRAGVLTPILLLTARGELGDKVTGLRSGADDYLVKPFEVDELLARLDALARRGRVGIVLQVGDLALDRLTRRATLGEAAIDLTAKEFALLARLALANGEPVERAQLLLDVWQLKFDPGSGVLDVHVSRLRDKLGDAAWMIETVRGTGYRLRGARPGPRS